MRLTTDVLIVGAGPAGLVLAIMLRRSGIDCIVVERHSRKHVESRARAGVLEYRTVELLRRHGLADGLSANGVRSESCELRCGSMRASVRCGDLTDGRTHVVYPQQYLVSDLMDDLHGEVLFSHCAVEIVDVDDPVVTCVGPDGTRIDICCGTVAGCDGARGLCRAALPWHVTEHRYDFDWVTVLARSPAGGVLYSLHENGFAGRFPRTADTNRFYLQCAAGDSVADWPDERVRQEIHRRASVRARTIAEKTVLEMRAAVVSPMFQGRVVLAGDAAHLVTPAGAKGANLAIADAAELARSIVDGISLRPYSDSRLARVWDAVEFSNWMLGLITTPSGAFDRELQLARLRRLSESRVFATAFAGMYVGAET